MDARLELQFDKSIIVIGAELTATLVTEAGARLPPLSFKSVCNALAESKVAAGDDASALLETFSPADRPLETTAATSSMIGRLQEMQRHGALLAYLYPDNVLDRAMEQEPLTYSNVDRWLEQPSAGIMHLFGSCSDADSIFFEDEKPAALDETVLRVFSERTCVCVGFTTDEEAQGDLEAFMATMQITNVLVAYESELPANGPGLSIAVRNITKAVSPIGDTSKAIGEMIEHSCNDLGRPLSLLMASKTDYVKMAMLLSSLPGMNFQLMSNLEYNRLTFHVLTVQVEQTKFGEFWRALMHPNILESLVNYAVLAIVLDQYSFVWLSGGKMKISSLPSSCDDLSSNVTVRDSLPSSSQDHQQQSNDTLSFSIAAVLKQPKTMPRYTVKKQKVESSLMNDSIVPPAVLRRRMSLPHNNVPTTMASATGGSGVINRGRHSSMVSGASPRQQLLLTRYFHNQQKAAAEQPNSSSSAKEDCKILRKLLQEKPKQFSKPSTKALKFLSDWIVEKRRTLFVNDSQEWSSHINDDLVKKMAKWRKMRERRAQLRSRRNEEDRVRRCSLDSTISSTSDTLRHHLAAANPPTPNYPSVQSPLLVNPYILPPQQAATNFTTLRTTPMVYPSPYLSSYHPVIAPMPTAVPYILPGTSNLVLMSNNNNTIGGLTTIAGNSIMSSSNSLGSTGCVPLSSTSFTSSLPTPPLTSLHVPSSSSTPFKLADVKSRRKRSNPEKSSTSTSSSVISSLLLSKESIQPPAAKQSRMVSSPASLSDEKSSDGESDHMSCDNSAENEDTQLSLWKFLLELLLSNSYSHLIDWVRIHSLEFHIKQPKEIAKLWSTYKSDSSIDCSRLRKALHYYCSKEKPILHLVLSKDDDMFRFSSTVLYYINNRYSQLQRNNLSLSSSSSSLEKSREVCGSQEVLVVD